MGQHLGVQDRRHGGFLAERDIGVPDIVVGRIGTAILRDHRDLGHLRYDIEHRMGRLDLAEAPGKGELAGGIDPLVGHEDHKMIEQCLANIGDGRVIEFAAKVDAMNFGTKGRVERAHVDVGIRHGGVPVCR